MGHVLQQVHLQGRGPFKGVMTEANVGEDLAGGGWSAEVDYRGFLGNCR